MLFFTIMKLVVASSILFSLASVALATPTSTSSAVAAAGSQIRTVQDPVYHLYIQSEPLGVFPEI